MYDYQVPDGYGDIFYMYVFDANENAILSNANYNLLGVQITDGLFLVRNWTGAYTILKQTPSLGTIQLYAQNLGQWFNTPTMCLTLNPTLQNTSVPVIEAKEYPIQGNIRFDLTRTAVRCNEFPTGVVWGATPSATAAPASQIAFFGVRRTAGYVSDPEPPDDGRPYFTKPHQIPYVLSLATYYQGGSIRQNGVTFQVPVQNYDFELRHITKFCYSGGAGGQLIIQDESQNGVAITNISAGSVQVNIPLPNALNQTLSVGVVGTTITVTLATGATQPTVTTTTYNDLVAVMVASVAASALVSTVRILGPVPENFVIGVPGTGFFELLSPPSGIDPAIWPSPFAITLYDGNKLARSNFPVLAEYLIDDTVTYTGRNFFPSPPIKYRVNSVIQFDLFSLLPTTFPGPLIVSLLFDGVWRIPCT
jgi:hypothetical protein